MSFDYLTVDRAGEIACVTFNRPEKANALNYGLVMEIEAAALSFRDDVTTRVVIFTGAGRNFCSGADLTDPGEDYDGTLLRQRRRRRIGERALQSILEMDQITITAWNGAAAGGGGCLAMATDFRIAADNSLLFFPEVDLGLNLMWRALPLCVSLVGPARAKRLMVGGERIDGRTLLEWGMVDRLVAPEALMDATHDMAAFYAAKPPIAAQMIKRSINSVATALDRAVMHMDVDQHLLARSSSDHPRAARAYRDGERGTYTGE